MEIKMVQVKAVNYKFVMAIIDQGNTLFMCLDEKDNVAFIKPTDVEVINP